MGALPGISGSLNALPVPLLRQVETAITDHLSGSPIEIVKQSHGVFLCVALLLDTLT